MDVRRRMSFLAGAASYWLAFAATLGVSFFLTPHLIADLGKPRYDVWCVVESVLAYFTLLDLGVAVCLVWFVARHRAADDTDELWDRVIDELVTAKHSPDLLRGFLQQTELPGLPLAA